LVALIGHGAATQAPHFPVAFLNYQHSRRSIVCAKFSLLAILALGVSHSPLRADEAVEKEVARLQGSWQLVSIEVGGTKQPNVELAKNRLLIKGDKFFMMDKDTTTGGGAFKIIEVVGKTRKTNLTFNNGLVGGGFTIAKWHDDDTFQTCFHARKRPTEFNASEQSGQVLMTFKRIKN
jgi:uncharacterized protein (TIGR03067 family)